jgi:sulfide dehydrogenase cytochrome subunit
MRRSMQVLFAVTLGLLVASVTWAADASPSMLGNACAPCHGTDGKSPSAIPALSGKSADYIVQRMLEFKAGARESTVMNRIAKGYTDAEIAAVAQHFAALGQAAAAGGVMPSALADACAACHGTDGKSPGAIPALSGKSTAYITQRMLEFKAGAREGTVMNRIARGYDDAEIAAIAQHLGNE